MAEQRGNVPGRPRPIVRIWPDGLEGRLRLCVAVAIGPLLAVLLLMISADSGTLAGNAPEGALCLGAAAIGAVLAFRLARIGIVGPIRTLTVVAAELGSEHAPAETAVFEQAPAEVRALADTFRRMGTRLRFRDQRIEALQRRSAPTLVAPERATSPLT